MAIYYKELVTPVGNMIVGANEAGIYLFDFQYRKAFDAIQSRISTYTQQPFLAGDPPYFKDLEQQIGEYFNGTRTVFDLPLQLAGSPFQVKVWEGLLAIPYGEVRSYKQQSIVLGDEKAIRAVATANGANGLAILVPCHRIIGTNGSLTGYAGGLDKKKYLLQHEQKHTPNFYQQELF